MMFSNAPNESFHRIAYAPGELCVGAVLRKSQLGGLASKCNGKNEK